MSVAQGYPDYSRLTPWSDQFFINDQLAVHPSGFSYGPFDASNIRALAFDLQSTNQDIGFEFDWFTDSTALNSVYTTGISVGSSLRAIDTMRPIAPYFKMSVSVLGGGNVNFSALVTSASSTPLPVVDVNEPRLINQISVAIPASTTVQVSALRWWRGRAFIQVFTSGTNFSWTLTSKDYQGNSQEIVTQDQSYPKGGVWVPVPSGILNLSVTNSDAAPHSYWATMVGDPTSRQ